MCRYQATVILFCAMLASGSANAQGTPEGNMYFQPGAAWRDDRGVAINAHGGGLLHYKGTYYWFGEHKVEGELGNTAQVGVHVYSSGDLYNWHDEGIALSVTGDPASDIVKGSIIERPKVIYNAKTQKFVMWFHLELKNKGYDAARAAVAISDKPTGPYTYLYSLRPNAGIWPVNATPADKVPGNRNILARDFIGGQMARDMTLFVDDDEKAYLIASSEENRTLHISELSDDYLKPTQTYARAIPDGGNEAPTLFKRDKRYYMITSGLTGWAPNAARSFVANSVLGPWTALGNPIRGSKEQVETTFGAQSTYVLPYQGGAIFMADRWNPKDAIDGRYVWLPLYWEGDKPVVRWLDQWTLEQVLK